VNSPNLREELLNAIISTMEAHGSMSRQALHSEGIHPARIGLRRADFGLLRTGPVNRSAPKTPGNLPLSAAVGQAESTASMGTGGVCRTRIKDAPAIFRPQVHSPRHLFHQPMLHRSTTKSIQINVLNLVGKIDQTSSFGENPLIRREKARPFRTCTIKVSGEKPANTGKFPSPPWAKNMFAKGEVA
jgi:hypothetical protein